MCSSVLYVLCLSVSLSLCLSVSLSLSVQTSDSNAFLRAARSGQVDRVLEFLSSPNFDLNTANAACLLGLGLMIVCSIRANYIDTPLTFFTFCTFSSPSYSKSILISSHYIALGFREKIIKGYSVLASFFNKNPIFL